MNKAKILRLRNEIEDAVNELAACCEIIDLHTHAMLIDKLREIAAEITAQPKSNGDRIRQMTDEELADVLQGQCICCAHQLKGCTEKVCKDGAYKWLKQEVKTDDER